MRQAAAAGFWDWGEIEILHGAGIIAAKLC
jgi:hypothetical protein